MQYRTDRKGNKLSILGYGCMRFTRSGGGIDYEKAERELKLAIENGVNYLDTAYIYPGSEALVGEILEKNNLRDRVYIATKLPHYMIRSVNGAEKMFREELKRLRTDHIDYYLMHMLNALGTWEKLKKMGMEEWIAGKMASGEIRNIGFSYHGNTTNFKPLLDAYDWDFCMVQYNYLDENSQAGREGVAYAAAKGLPVMIMEPLRGGELTGLLPEAAKKAIAADPKKRSAAELAFSWLWNQPEVTCVLSGMNSEEMIAENVRTASGIKADSFTTEDFALIEAVREAINGTLRVRCTGCGYCMPCPKNVDIPGAFHALNLLSLKKGSAKRQYLQSTVMRKTPTSASQCVGCGKCEQHCPQHLPIREKLKEASSELETLPYRVVRFGIKTLKIYG